MYYGYNYACNNIELIDQSNMDDDNDDDTTGNDSGDKLKEGKKNSNSIND